MSTTYGLTYKQSTVGTSFHCATEKPYVNVELTANNDQGSSYAGWMRFSPTGKVWIPFTHWVLDTDVNGQWHIIGEPCGEMVFIMSRTRSISPDLYNFIVQRIKDLGFAEAVESADWKLGCDQQ